MLFNSLPFVILVLVTLALYYLPPLKGAQRHLLIAASFVFYAANHAALLVLLVCSIAINVAASHLVAHGRPAWRVAWAAGGVAVNLAALAFFKYGPLFGRTLWDGAGSVGAFLVAIPLPIGISFFTFQGITLLVDTLRARGRRGVSRIRTGRRASIPCARAGGGSYCGGNRRTKSDTLRARGRRDDPVPTPGHAVNTTLYIAFFPQLVAGPIVKAHDFLPQITPKFLAGVDWTGCFRHLVTGYFLKMVVADNLKDQTFWIAYPYFEAKGPATLVAMLVGYSAQIFADFAGYSLIAIGVAGLFGYRLPPNFNFPYISRSFSEFWRRWHISLSSFLKEYLYVPLGGNRRGRARTYANLMVVMLLGGLWHGAAWSYMVWGGCHGAALALERFLSGRVRVPDHWLADAARMAGVFTCVTLAWLLFKLPEFGHAVGYVRAILHNGGRPESTGVIAAVAVYSLPVALYHLHHLRGGGAAAPTARLAPALYGVMLFLLVTNSGAPGAFVYFQF